MQTVSIRVSIRCHAIECDHPKGWEMQSLSIEDGRWNRTQLCPTLHRGCAPICFAKPIGRDRPWQTRRKDREDLLPLQQVEVEPLHLSRKKGILIWFLMSAIRNRDDHGQSRRKKQVQKVVLLEGISFNIETQKPSLRPFMRCFEETNPSKRFFQN